jgi:energy-coupling factor transporter ATP-binding protein EcfA2
MLSPDEKLTALLDSFARKIANDPGALEPHDPRYVSNLHGTPAEDVVVTMKRAIERLDGSARFYFTGQRGTGKSTELRRLAGLLNKSTTTRAFVVDALGYIAETHPITLNDLLLLVALAFAEAIKESAGQDFLKEDLATRFGNWLETEVALTGFTVGGAKVELKAQQQSVSERIREFDLARQERMIDESRKYITELADFARKHFGCEKVVLIVDSLERLRGSGADTNPMFERVVKVFDGGVNNLLIDRLQVIYAVPPYLTFLTNVQAYAQVFTLASVRVCQRPVGANKRQPREEGLQVMREVVTLRFADWSMVLSQEALDHLIFHSGGDLRQLLRRFLIDVIDQCYFVLSELPLNKGHKVIATTIARLQGEYDALVVRDEYPLLKNIAETNTVDISNRERDLPVAARFFDIRAVLSYRNGVDWVDLNPLLWPLIDKYTPPAPSNAAGEA